MRKLYTFVALVDSIKDENVIKYFTRPDIEIIFIKEGEPMPEKKDRPVIALVQCDQILENLFVRLPGKGVVLATPRWAQSADCAVGISHPQKARRKDPLGKSRTYGQSFNIKKAITCMLNNWGFEKRQKAA